MKKIIAILCGVTMLFAACTQNDGPLPRPTFPELSTYEILSGKAQKLLFNADVNWELAVDYEFAYVKDSEGHMVNKVSGKAGEKIEAWVGVYSGIENYDNDINFNVTITMNGYTETLATFTIKQIEYTVQTENIEAGMMKTLATFWATEKWELTLSEGAREYVYFQIGDEQNDVISGPADNQAVSVRIYAKENIKNYDKDIVFSVYRKMGNAEAKEWAKLTIKKIERPAAITMEQTEDTVTFEKDGHPAGGGEFPDAVEKYHLNYSSEWDLEGYSSVCNLEEEVSIKVYAYNKEHKLVEASTLVENSDSTNVGEEDEATQPKAWVSVMEFGEDHKKRGFKVQMDITQAAAMWSWNNFEKCYESYVNFVDKDDNVLVSLYCTYTPGTISEEVCVKLNNPTTVADLMELAGSGSSYTLTLKDPQALNPENAEVCGFTIQDVKNIYFEVDDLVVTNYPNGNYYHIALRDPSIDPSTITLRSCTMYAENTDGVYYTINVVLDWVQEEILESAK